jgi:hypothetical protein
MHEISRAHAPQSLQIRGRIVKAIVATVLMVVTADHLSIAAPPPSIAPTATPHPTFAALFGIELPRAKKEMPAELSHCLEKAYEDFNLALDNKPLRNATRESAAAADGGTSIWIGPCYSMTVYRAITHICVGTKVVSGFTVGPELRFSPNREFPERPGISRTRFLVFKKQSDHDPAIECDTKRDF